MSSSLPRFKKVLKNVKKGDLNFNNINRAEISFCLGSIYRQEGQSVLSSVVAADEASWDHLDKLYEPYLNFKRKITNKKRFPNGIPVTKSVDGLNIENIAKGLIQFCENNKRSKTWIPFLKSLKYNKDTVDLKAFTCGTFISRI